MFASKLSAFACISPRNLHSFLILFPMLPIYISSSLTSTCLNTDETVDLNICHSCWRNHYHIFKTLTICCFTNWYLDKVVRLWNITAQYPQISKYVSWLYVLESSFIYRVNVLSVYCSRVGYMYVDVSGFQNHKANVQYISVVTVKYMGLTV